MPMPADRKSTCTLETPKLQNPGPCRRAAQQLPSVPSAPYRQAPQQFLASLRGKNTRKAVSDQTAIITAYLKELCNLLTRFFV